MATTLLRDKTEWDRVFETLCRAHDCPKKFYDDIANNFPRGESTAIFDCAAYVRYLADAAATRVLYCPEMSLVAGNLLTFFTRWYVSSTNEPWWPLVKMIEKDGETEPPQPPAGDLDKALAWLEKRHIHGGRIGCSYEKLIKMGRMSGEFMDSIDKFGGAIQVESLLQSNWRHEYEYDFLAMRTALDVYVQCAEDGTPLETLGEAYLRTALHLHGGDPSRVRRTYRDLIGKRCMFGTPVIANSGLARRTNLSSCFLLGMPTMKKLPDVFAILTRVADCLDRHGGVGISLAAYNSREYGGIMPLMKLLNDTVNMMKFNRPSRPGAIAVYLEPWHPEISDFLEVRINHGDERKRCRDLFTALWIPDLFMKRVCEDGVWSLFDPTPGSPGSRLRGCYGEEFERVYAELESAGEFVSRVNARMLWTKMMKSQINTGTPYVLYKDSCIEKSVHRDLGPINCSNLCTEVIQFSDCDGDSITECKLASVCLPAFLTGGDEGGEEAFKMDWVELERTVENLVFSLNNIEDQFKSEHFEKKEYASIGIGVQGLADVFFAVNTHWGSPLSMEINTEIFERLYFYALKASCGRAKLAGRPFCDYEKTELASGVLQFDHWDEKRSLRMNWDELRKDIREHGLSNSLVTSLMPTVTTSQMTGYAECFEPVISNIYTRRTRSGEYQMVNRHLVKALRAKGKFDEDTMRRIQRDDGSVQGLDDVFDETERLVFRAVWEIPQDILIDMAADRAPFIDHSQSMNLYLAEPDNERLSDLLFYGWAKGLKTGMYYLRSRPAASAIKFTLMPAEKKKNDGPSCEIGVDCVGCHA